MLKSLLQTKIVPPEVMDFIQQKAEGNPFYIEEVINSLIESGILTRDNGDWKLDREVSEADIPSTIHGVLAARIDRLEKVYRRILQEASVIGRVFFYEVLKRITDIQTPIDEHLGRLKGVDLIRTMSLEPDLEYIFKHALIQEVVYNGLLKKERQEIHERIGLTIEKLFENRLPEFYETLAFHYGRGQSFPKALDYLMKSGEKSLRRYAVEESHRYYNEAFDLLTNKPDKTKDEDELLIDLLNEWAYVFYYRGEFRKLEGLFSAHEDLAESLDDKARTGMFYTWLGLALYFIEDVKGSYKYLRKALMLGEGIDNKKIIGYACTWLTRCFAEFGLLDEAINYAERSHDISRILPADQFLFFNCLDAFGVTYFCKGDSKRNSEIGKILLDYGSSRSSIRCLVIGHVCMGYSYLTAGNFPLAIKCYQRAVEVSSDPVLSQYPKIFLGLSYVSNGQFLEAENILKELESNSQNVGNEIYRKSARGLLGVVLIAKGHMARGLKMGADMAQSFLETPRKYNYAASEYILGRVYFQIMRGAGPISLSTVAKNIFFLLKNVPWASIKAETHFNKAIQAAKEIGAKGLLGQAYLALGLLHKAKKRSDQAGECLYKAVQLFEQCEADVFLQQANEALASLG